MMLPYKDGIELRLSIDSIGIEFTLGWEICVVRFSRLCVCTFD